MLAAAWKRGRTGFALRTLVGGGTLQASIEAAADADRGTPEELAPRVFRWFSTWVAEGFFRSIEV